MEKTKTTNQMSPVANPDEIIKELEQSLANAVKTATEKANKTKELYAARNAEKDEKTKASYSGNIERAEKEEKDAFTKIKEIEIHLDSLRREKAVVLSRKAQESYIQVLEQAFPFQYAKTAKDYAHFAAVATKMQDAPITIQCKALYLFHKSKGWKEFGFENFNAYGESLGIDKSTLNRKKKAGKYVTENGLAWIFDDGSGIAFSYSAIAEMTEGVEKDDVFDAIEKGKITAKSTTKEIREVMKYYKHDGEIFEDKPTEDKPTEDKPTEDKPTEDKPTEDKPRKKGNGDEIVLKFTRVTLNTFANALKDIKEPAVKALYESIRIALEVQ